MKDDRITTEEKLVAYIEGTLSEEEKATIEEQLKESEEMRESLSDLRKTIEFLQGLEEVDTPGWFTQKIMSKVREEAEQKKGVFERLFSPLQMKLPIQAFALLFLVVVAIFIYRAYQPEDTIRSTGNGIQNGGQQTEEVWGDVRVTVSVENIGNASSEVQSTVADLGGIVLRKQSLKNRNILFVLLDLQRVNELYDRLKPIGEVKQEGDLSTVKGDVKVKIVIVQE